MTLSSVSGRAGANVAAVDIVLVPGTHVWATLANGWFAAWWPTGDGIMKVQPFDAIGTPLAPGA